MAPASVIHPIGRLLDAESSATDSTLQVAAPPASVAATV
jgi:hypothetical protein